MTGAITYNGNLIEVIVNFSHKPTQNQTFTVTNYGFGPIAPIEQNKAIISLEYGAYTSVSNGSQIVLTVIGDKIIANMNNVELAYKSSGSLPNCKLTCTLKG